MRYSNRDCGMAAVAMFRLGYLDGIRSEEAMAADEELWDAAHQRGMRAAEWAEIEASLALGELPVAVVECPL